MNSVNTKKFACISILLLLYIVLLYHGVGIDKEVRLMLFIGYKRARAGFMKLIE